MAGIYRVNEIFHSIQGEGVNAGVPAVFVRFSGCNLSCPFCDTDHAGATAMTAGDIVAEINRYPATLVVLTGGEPSMQADSGLVAAIRAAGRKVAVETNGTRPLPANVDFVTLSPKDAFCASAKLVLDECDELKVVFCGDNNPARYDRIKARHRVLQPCDTGDTVRNVALAAEALDYCLAHPQWRLGLQLHKILNVR